MVYIKRLEVRDFKSLGGKPTIIHFSRGLTCITGPNGSGKSNIIDAILFCIGQNSPKALRVDRLTSLLYETESGQRAPRARVTLTLDNRDRQLPVDADTVTITREVDSKGTNTYWLNGRRITRSRLLETLGLALISPDGLNIVPQGLVTRFAELTPDGKRQVIEGLVGVAQFDEKKAEAMKQLHQADMELKVALARMNAIKEHVSSLEAERNDQLRFQHLKDEINRLRAMVVSEQIESVRRQLERARREVRERSDRIRGLEGELKGVEEEIQRVEAERKSFISEVVEGSGGRQAEIQREIGQVRSDIDILSRRRAEAEGIIAQVEETLPTLYQMREAQEKKLSEFEAQAAELEAAIQGLEADKAAAEKELRQLGRQIARCDRVLETARAKRARLEGLRVKALDRLGKARNRAAVLQSQLEGEVERLESLRAKAESYAQALQQAETRLKRLAQHERTEREALAKARAALGEVRQRRARLAREVAQAHQILRRAGETLLAYEAQRDVVEEFAHQELGYQRLRELVDAGALEGVLGRLRELVRYEPRYDVAVRAAAARWLDAIVVEDLKAMVRAVEVARRLQVGRLTFIPLSEVAETPRVEPPRLQGVMGTLAEYVDAAEGLEGVINLVFGGTVLVTSPRAGYLVAARGLRSVTLQGDLFEPRGLAFETGRLARIEKLNEILRRSRGLKPVKEVLDTLKRILEKRQSDLKALEAEEHRLDREVLARTLNIKRLRGEQANFQSFLARYRRMSAVNSRRARDQEARVERLKARLERAAKKVEELEALVERYGERLAGLRVEELESERAGLRRRRAEIAARIEELSIGIGEKEAELARIRGEIEHDIRPDLERTVEEIERGERALPENRRLVEECDKRLEELRSRLAELEEEDRALLEASKRVRPILERYDRQLRGLRARAEQLKREMGRLEREILSIERRMDALRHQEQGLMRQLRECGFTELVEGFPGAEEVLSRLEEEHRALEFKVNMLADRNYKEAYQGYKNLSVRRNRLEAERNAIVEFIESVEAEKRRVYLEAFERIDRELRPIFNRLTGGSAWLEIENPDDIFGSGVFLMAQFPGKAARESSVISGGEKSVTAISFILAVQALYPAPFYLFDEIDAFLDAVNLPRLVDLLKERSERSQIIVATLKDVTLARADSIIGVFMDRGVSRVVRYRPQLEVAVSRE
jgi:chromosome segregation protein